MNSYALRNEVLREIGFASYDDYLKSPLWASVRDRAYKELGRDCFKCGRPARVLHHTHYSKWLLYGATLDGLLPLCDRCHRDAEFDSTGHKRRLDEANAALGMMPYRKPAKPKKDKKPKREKRVQAPKKPVVATQVAEECAYRKITEAGQLCTWCQTPVVERKATAKYRRGQNYAFRWYLYCPGCGRMYMVEEAKYMIATNAQPERQRGPRDETGHFCECGNHRKAGKRYCRACERNETREHKPDKPNKKRYVSIGKMWRNAPALTQGPVIAVAAVTAR